MFIALMIELIITIFETFILDDVIENYSIIKSLTLDSEP